jgi:hypothetical protein
MTSSGDTMNIEQSEIDAHVASIAHFKQMKDTLGRAVKRETMLEAKRAHCWLAERGLNSLGKPIAAATNDSRKVNP